MIEYPLPRFHFQVKIDGFETQFSFKEVSGINTNIGIDFPISGLPNVKVLSCKMGWVVEDERFNNWVKTCLLIPANLRQINNNLGRRIEIYLMNEEHVPIVKWQIENAIPINFSVSNINPSEKIIEKFELEYESSTYFSIH